MARHRRKKTVCPNCGTKMDAVVNFCPNCGQENHDINVPLKHLFLDIIENTFHFDTKFFHSIKSILLRPGKITTEFNLGKRANYVSPARLYVFITAIYFVVLSFNRSHPPNVTPAGNQFVKEVQVKGTNITVGAAELHLSYEDILLARHAGKDQMDSLLRSKKTEPTWINRAVVKNMSLIASDPEGEKHFIDRLLKNISIAMFFLMPVMAFLLFLFQSRRKFLYIHHLIFSLHFHTVLFFILLLSEASVMLFSFSFIKTAWLAVFIYLLVSIRNVYAQGWIISFFKFLLIVTVYGLFTLLGIAVTVAIGFLLV